MPRVQDKSRLESSFSYDKLSGLGDQRLTNLVLE
jgi:hypothetical protein